MSFNKSAVIKILLWASGSVACVGIFTIILYKLYIPRLAAFGCFDDCYNYGGGYFITLGKQIYRDFYFNHLPGMPFLSAIIQVITKPINVYEFLLRHRQFVILWGALWNILILFRFRLKAIPGIILYELTKFVLFGDRFLAEALIVYPFVYMTLLLFDRPLRRIVYFDTGIALFSFLFITFFREPYVPAAAVLYAVILWRVRHSFSLAFWIITPLLIFLTCYILLSPSDFRYSLFSNLILVSKEQAAGNLSFIKSYSYPVLTLLSFSTNTYLRIINPSISALFVLGILLLRRKWGHVVFIWFLLGTLNIRPPAVGQPFYGAFHLLPWYAVQIASTTAILFELIKVNKKLGALLFSGYVFVILFAILSPKAFFHETINSHGEFITNYSEELQISNVINALSKPTDTLFLDGWAELIFPLTHLRSSYKYNWYTGYMPFLEKYSTERLAMFHQNPPDIYYGTCPNEVNSFRFLPDFAKPLYTNIPSGGKMSCLWMKTSILPTIKDDQWKKAKESLYDKPESSNSGTIIK